MDIMNSNNLNELIEYLPPNWRELARETKAFTRARNIKTEDDLLALNMFYITNDGSFQLASTMMKMARGISVNKNAVYERITASGEWLRSMAMALCQQALGASYAKPEFLGDKRVRLIDASDEVTRGKDKTTWRLHYDFDLFGFILIQVKNRFIFIRKTPRSRRFSEFRFNVFNIGLVLIVSIWI